MSLIYVLNDYLCCLSLSKMDTFPNSHLPYFISLLDRIECITIGFNTLLILLVTSV